MNGDPKSRAAVTVEVFGWLDFVLGVLVLVAPYHAAAILHLPALDARDAGNLRLVATLVTALGVLYIVSGRLKSEGFAVASLLDRPLVPVIMAILWLRHIVPGPAALLFSLTDFGGFLWTLFAWRADTRLGLHAGGPDLPPQTRGGRVLERFGLIQIVAGFLVLLAPHWTASLLQLSFDARPGPDYFRLAGLLAGGLGVLYFVSGTFSARGAVAASLFVRPIVAGILIDLVSQELIETPLAVAGIAYELIAFTWTLYAWIEDRHETPARVSLFARCAASLFALVSALRDARTFHPDGRLFRGTVRALEPSAATLTGDVLLRIGMGVAKKRTPASLADRIPDAPSIACRFAGAGDKLDLLCTAGGDRLWKLVLNLATGGRKYGLNQFDYFANEYFAQVPYRIDGGKSDVWLRLVPAVRHVAANDSALREAALTAAVAEHAVLRLEAQRAGDPNAPFVPIAEIAFEEEIRVDQEALHFDPLEGRGFEPHGFFTGLRRVVYPSSVQSRPASKEERELRDRQGVFRRFARYLDERPIAWHGRRRWVTLAMVVLLVAVIAGVLSLLERFTRDVPVDYAGDELHFMRGSTGGERKNGIPYWYWVALPEVFPELLPDKKPGRGYSSFGLVYDPKDDPRYALPYGVSMRRTRGFDAVYLNCGACHIGTVRDAPGAPPRLIVAGMPSHQFDLGAFARFLMQVPLSEKFTGVRMLEQIRKMQNDRHRLAPKPDVIDRFLYKYVVAVLMREQLVILRDRLSFIDTTTWGPGRVDTFNAPKALLNFPMDKAPKSELMGNVDFPSVWNQRPREGMHLHWDGNNTKVAERNLSASFGTGAYPANLDAPRVQRMQRYLDTARPPEYPYPKDRVRIERGKAVYAEYCAGCHGTREAPFRHEPPRPGENVGTVVDVDKIGTDRSRLDSYTWPLAVNQSTLYAGFEKEWGFDGGYPQRFSHFRKTNGYANMPLDGIWLRAPYLHNGSVPTLWELLKPAAQRVPTFYTGNDVYDPRNVGFVSDVAVQNGRELFLFNTGLPGNGNGGHEDKPGAPAVYGTNLPDGDKWALIEYLKTF